MIRINLLPHREAKRKLKKTAFIAMMVAAALVGGVVVMIVGGYNASRISIQNERNAVLTAANAELDKKIAKIADLEQEIEALKARQQAVEDLQGDRNQPVYLLEELVRQTPQGVHMTSFKQEAQRVTLTGYAQSQERVAELLRNLSSGSAWLEAPQLIEVRSVNLPGSKTGKKVGEFTMAVGIKRPRDKDAKEDAGGAAGAKGKRKAGARDKAEQAN
ncbi:PilN domain-containing protein [Massilia sp. PAMC28688]|uniref:PilN domain-containing protein n=1 Tax=Massilia sp. PAMC28688 TaxID=2861283 RepID=UPI001C62FCB1|nr:PilN domain-containing protein [Massilia sp. PAMC28688]QYF94774.1 PilN domain-containing protein [Massilia sp. PAMC28688]